MASISTIPYAVQTCSFRNHFVSAQQFIDMANAGGHLIGDNGRQVQGTKLKIASLTDLLLLDGEKIYRSFLNCSTCNQTIFEIKVCTYDKYNHGCFLNVEDLKTQLVQMQVLPRTDPPVNDRSLAEKEQAWFYWDAKSFGKSCAEGPEAKLFYQLRKAPSCETTKWQFIESHPEWITDVIAEISHSHIVTLQALAYQYGDAALVKKYAHILDKVLPIFAREGYLQGIHACVFEGISHLTCAWNSAQEVKGLRYLPYLKALDIDKITKEAATELAQFLREKDQLKGFDLNLNGKDEENIVAILSGLKHQTHLEHLSISFEYQQTIPPAILTGFVEVLKNNNIKDISFYNVGKNTPEIITLLKVLSTTALKKVLIHGSYRAGENNLHAILETVSQFTTLKEVSLVNFCNLHDNWTMPTADLCVSSLQALLPLINNNQGLTGLDLSNNYLSLQAACDLSLALSKTKVLKKIGLANCFLSPESFSQVLKGLSLCPSIETAFLQDAHLSHWWRSSGPQKWELLAKGTPHLKNHPSLKALYLPEFDPNSGVREVVINDLYKLEYINEYSVAQLSQKDKIRRSAAIPLNPEHPDYEIEWQILTGIICSFGGPDDRYEAMGIEYCAKNIILKQGQGIINGVNYRDDVYDIVSLIASNRANYSSLEVFFELIQKECLTRNVPMDALLDILEVAYPPSVWSPWNKVVEHFRPKV